MFRWGLGPCLRGVTRSCSCIVLGLCADDAAKKTLLLHSPAAPQQGEASAASIALPAVVHLSFELIYLHPMPLPPTCCASHATLTRCTPAAMLALLDLRQL